MKIKRLPSQLKTLKIGIATKSAATTRKQGRPQKRERLAVLERDGYLCVKCKEKGLIEAAREVDHIVPLHLGGADTAENKQGLCIECHRLKSLEEDRNRRL